MIRKFNLRNLGIRLIAVMLIVLVSASYSNANEQIETTEAVDKSNYIEIEVVEDLNYVDNQREFVYAKSNISDYKAESLDSRDILRTIPSITTNDKKMLGLVIPPFAYFAKKF